MPRRRTNMTNQEKGQMSVSEAGKRGGETRREQLGHEGYQELGHMGGQRVKDLINKGKEMEGEE